MKKVRHILLLLTVLFVNSSCLHRQFVEGRAEIVSTYDAELNDSSLVFGYVYYLDWPDKTNYFEDEFDIWIENSDLRTTNDTTGYYSIKTKPGTYTMKCQSRNNEWERLIEEVKDIELSKNKKIEIDFYIGYTIE